MALPASATGIWARRCGVVGALPLRSGACDIQSACQTEESVGDMDMLAFEQVEPSEDEPNPLDVVYDVFASLGFGQWVKSSTVLRLACAQISTELVLEGIAAWQQFGCDRDSFCVRIFKVL